MPWTPPPRPSRRSLLAGAAGAALLTGCSGAPADTGATAGVSLERGMREAAVRDSERLLERYDATSAAHPALAARLAPLRSAVAAHTAALASPASPSASRTPGTGSAKGSAAPAPDGGTPAASAEPVPPKAEDALAALADAERSLAEARTVALGGAPGELARLLASVAACGAVHTHLLTSPPGATP
ncbi:hypothetical protein HYE82_06760 [Streptomyces sp. BR123]|uniref:hypothetical protein n=1 Tax=Streptomyces sp. BR123 TaxID=2749828 RepID=UPI0015C49E2F|nr:hypothetical protein [Streptomyces sp. BR123]NXY94099.1 hypothetical protein [Streptomyces sp. BR123]